MKVTNDSKKVTNVNDWEGMRAKVEGIARSHAFGITTNSEGRRVRVAPVQRWITSGAAGIRSQREADRYEDTPENRTKPMPQSVGSRAITLEVDGSSLQDAVQEAMRLAWKRWMKGAKPELIQTDFERWEAVEDYAIHAAKKQIDLRNMRSSEVRQKGMSDAHQNRIRTSNIDDVEFTEPASAFDFSDLEVADLLEMVERKLTQSGREVLEKLLTAGTYTDAKGELRTEKVVHGRDRLALMKEVMDLLA